MKYEYYYFGTQEYEWSTSNRNSVLEYYEYEFPSPGLWVARYTVFATNHSFSSNFLIEHTLDETPRVSIKSLFERIFNLNIYIETWKTHIMFSIKVVFG